MGIIRCIWHFYKKLILPSMSISIATGLLGLSISGNFPIKWIGFTYVLLAPLFHYSIYEIMNKNEYYFYFNLGLSKTVLWAITLSVSLLLAIILSLL